MEKKTIQRIMGILIAIALVIIILPLFFDKSDADIQEAIKSPSFPDQQQPMPETVASADQQNIANSVVPDAETMNDEPQNIAATTTSTHPVANTAAPENNDVKKETSSPEQALSTDSNDSQAEPSIQQNSASNSTADQVSKKPVSQLSQSHKIKSANSSEPQPIAKTEEPKNSNYSVISNKANEEQKQTPENPIIAIDKSEDGESAEVKVIPASKPVVETQEPKKIVTASSKIQESVSLNLKKTAWVVQLGSFKDKNNARRLADRLRSAGYKAFMHETKTVKGSGTRTKVYIGPEYQQASAAKLSTKLEQQMKLHGFITKYKPLEL